MPQRPPIKTLGPPTSGRVRRVFDLPQAPEHLWRRLYIRGMDEGLENLHGYRPGGYHPIHLQKELHHGRYRVLQELGHGGYSTVWLCRDQHADVPAYVAVKILVASETTTECRELITTSMKMKGLDNLPGGQHLCFPLAQFESQSPNGTHICLVYPVFGPASGDARRIFEGQENATEALRKLSRQAAEALGELHSRGICHGVELRHLQLSSLLKNRNYGFSTLQPSFEAEES